MDAETVKPKPISRYPHQQPAPPGKSGMWVAFCRRHGVSIPKQQRKKDGGFSPARPGKSFAKRTGRKCTD
jgi:hypothetical protein